MHPDETYSISLHTRHPVMPVQELIEAIGLAAHFAHSVESRQVTATD